MLNPTRNAATKGSLAAELRKAVSTILRDDVEDMIPARVVAHDRTSNRVTVQPLVALLTTDGTKVSRATVTNIPVFRFGGGGFFISVPVQAGDFGWLKASDKDISLIMQRGGLEDQPNTERTHSFADGMFFPDTITGWMIDGKNLDALVIQSMDGSTCIAMDSGRVEIDAEEIKINGDVTVVGNFAATGTMHNNSVNVGSDHRHTGVQAGSNNSGTPI